MSVISLFKSADNPVTTQVVDETITSLPKAICPKGVKIAEKDKEGYAAILAGGHEVFKRIAAMPDYIPYVDKSKYPRKDVRAPEGKEKESNAWAWKCSVKADKTEGLLKGKTVTLKDNIILAEIPCKVGTNYIEDWIPKTDATVATRILAAGGEITGKAVCENLSFFGASLSAGSGPMDNAYAKGYSAGGSSSGCGVLVARGECDMSIGGDQGGSVRLPAAQNGIVGMKPTHGLIPYTGVCLLESTIDTLGPMTKTVLDNALLLSAIAGSDGIDDRQGAGCPVPPSIPIYASLAKGGIDGLRIGIITESLHTEHTDERYAKSVVDAAMKFKELGAAVVEEVSIECFNIAADVWSVIARLSAYQNMTGRACGRRALYLNDFTEKWLPLTQDKFDQMWPSAVATLINGAYGWDNIDPTLMGKTMNLAQKCKDEVDAILGKYDLLVTPTLPCLPRRIDHNPQSVLDKMAVANGIPSCTVLFSLTGHPAISIPTGFLSPPNDPDVKLPMGMQIIGKFWDEGTIYRAAYKWEQAVDWKTRS